MKKILATVAVAGLLTLGVGAVPAEAHNRVCKTVTVPKTEPWYKCLSSTARLPAGCYVQSKVVCS